jgi:hypothetical protein
MVEISIRIGEEIQRRNQRSNRKQKKNVVTRKATQCITKIKKEPKK